MYILYISRHNLRLPSFPLVRTLSITMWYGAVCTPTPAGCIGVSSAVILPCSPFIVCSYTMIFSVLLKMVTLSFTSSLICAGIHRDWQWHV
ncbi:uncharacterized protein BO97DRAFT_7721 [Aspergillus homomorphus CBS 101889]|uniref:Uncharacterized protein n=1 Tax=Aspergillus homomorphus (strain CBS 101889) TaxID=1450537 RepID=A0A395IBV0_ASPHC|nr:hypothetical protein BO97DRAFT_7721 [Aspergillus homomorphus CBS 101889]RAL17511.1 hypothetical protein BO97DRAFT_7721 [Aspergillus homomorphus CBS 101889]